MKLTRGLGTALLVTVLAGGAATACDAADDEDQSAATTSQATGGTAAGIVWGQCPPVGPGVQREPREQCGTVKVPLDYRNPGGETIDLAVSRIPSAKPDKRRGVLVLNPGGPALPGLDMPSSMAPTLPESVLDTYDLIGFDPRGVEHSTAQSCKLADPLLFDLFPYPAADGSITANVDAARSVAQQCAAGAGDKLKFFNTDNTARDIDRIREALGEQKISYWGQSYGTYLGTVYNTLFADKVDKMIVEGNVDPDTVWQNAAAGWGKGMDERFPDVAKAAAAQNATLGMGATADAVTQNYIALGDRIDRTPIALPGTSQSLTGTLFRGVTYSMLLHNETVPVLAQFWAAVRDLADGHPSDADAQVLQQVLAGESTTSPGIPEDNMATMFLALMCGDAEWSRDVNSYTTKTAADRRQHPITAGMPGDIWPCAFWPAPIEAPVKVTDQGARNTLILQNKRDNATPWDGGEGLHRALGRRSAFVGADNGGHYVYHTGSSCVDTATIDFLTSGKLPAKDVYCTDVATP